MPPLEPSIHVPAACRCVPATVARPAEMVVNRCGARCWNGTKVWISDYGDGETLHAFDKSAGKLGVDTIDLLILHQALPTDFDRTLDAYRALKRLPADGRVRAIGVSNFMVEHLDRLLAATSIVPSTRSSCTRTSSSPTSRPQARPRASSPKRGHRSAGSPSTATARTPAHSTTPPSATSPPRTTSRLRK